MVGIHSHTGRSKRFTSAYVHFSFQKQYELIDELGPSATINEIARKIAIAWDNMSESERAPWEAKAGRDKRLLSAGCGRIHKGRRALKRNQYDSKDELNKSDLQRNISGSGPIKVSTASSVARMADTKLKKNTQKTVIVTEAVTKPKRPISAYLFFAQKMRPVIKRDNPSLSGLDITRQIGIAWNRTTEKEREPFYQLQADNRREYQAAMGRLRKNNRGEAATMPAHKEDRRNNSTCCQDEKNLKADAKGTQEPLRCKKGATHDQQLNDRYDCKITLQEGIPLVHSGRYVVLSPAQHDLKTNSLLHQGLLTARLPTTCTFGIEHLTTPISSVGPRGLLHVGEFPGVQALYINQVQPFLPMPRAFFDRGFTQQPGYNQINY